MASMQQVTKCVVLTQTLQSYTLLQGCRILPRIAYMVLHTLTLYLVTSKDMSTVTQSYKGIYSMDGYDNYTVTIYTYYFPIGIYSFHNLNSWFSLMHSLEVMCTY